MNGVYNYNIRLYNNPLCNISIKGTDYQHDRFQFYVVFTQINYSFSFLFINKYCLCFKSPS